MANTEQKQRFIELRAKGNSFSSIAESISVSKPTLIKWSDELESDISNLKAIEQEALREQYLATKTIA
jgi:DNA invertase Pin-like site-specific DNA recombinase